MSDDVAGPGRGSVDPCPVCGRHTLALDRPPHLPVTGAQPYTELYRMGDLEMPVGVRCRTCGTAWPTIEALRRGDPGSAEPIEPVAGLDEGPAWTTPDVPTRRPVAARSPGIGGAAVTLAAIGVGVVLLVSGLLVPGMGLLIVGAVLVGLIRRRGR